MWWSSRSPTNIGLHELDWIETNRRKVDQASGGRIGYVYLPDMGAAGLNDFVKQFFPQIRKEGMIFDVRYNGGGFVDQIIFERLRRVLAGMDSARNFETGHHPADVFYGHMACITNHYAASDGDFFSYLLQGLQAGSADRRANLGRRARHSRGNPADGWRICHAARVLAVRAR